MLEKLEWAVGAGITLAALYGAARFHRRCPECTRWLLVPFKEHTEKSPFGEATFEQKRCTGCGFIKKPTT